MKVGFFPTTGDPIHYGHLFGAMKALKTLELDIVYIQVCGDLKNHKPDKVSKHHRHQMAKLAIKEFSPYLKYTPIGYDNSLMGEDNFVLFVNSKNQLNIQKFYYITGSENAHLVLDNLSRLSKILERPYDVVVITRKNYVSSYDEDVIVIEDEINFSSKMFRQDKNTSYIPKVVQRYCKSHHLYWYK